MVKSLDIPLEELPTLVTLDWNLQKARIALVQQIDALEAKGVDTSSLEVDILTPLLVLEKEGVKRLRKCVHNHAIWNYWLKNVGGIGEKFAAQLIHLITGKKHTEECQKKRDKYFAKKKPGEKRGRGFTCDCPVMGIERFHSISALWKYAGLNTECYCRDCRKKLDDDANSCTYCGSTNIGRQAPRKRRGQKVTWNPRLRSVIHNIEKSFVIYREGPYRPYYDEYREFYDLKDPHLSKGHRDARARRKTGKLFMSHLYEMWYRALGLVPPKTYAEEHLGHVHHIPPPGSEEARRLSGEDDELIEEDLDEEDEDLLDDEGGEIRE